jgi:hypothetical protein
LFEYGLHPVGPAVLAGMVAYDLGDGPEVLRCLRDLLAQAPDELGVIAILRLAPPLAEVPAHLHGRPIVSVVVCHAGPVEQGEAAVAPLRAFGRPVLDTIAPRPYLAHQQLFVPAFPTAVCRPPGADPAGLGRGRGRHRRPRGRRR